MATATLPTVKYNYQDYLNEFKEHSAPDQKPLTEGEFRENLATYLGYSLQIGEAIRNNQGWRREELEAGRLPYAKALLLED
jgi:hypothetical protein